MLRDQHTIKIDSEQDFYAFFTPKNPNKPEIHGGFALAHFNGSPAVEEKLKNDLKVTVRCIPHDFEVEPGTCIFTGEPSRQRVIFAKAY
jgi:prolyl-tRNA synthetase